MYTLQTVMGGPSSMIQNRTNSPLNDTVLTSYV